MTVTLQDVAMILGLRIHGPPITSTCDIDWSLLCSELLGVVPPPYQIRGSSISARWLSEQFSYQPVGVDDVILERYARAFILALLGGALFTDKIGTHVQLCYLPLLETSLRFLTVVGAVQCWHTYIESYVVRVWIVPQRFLNLSHYYRYFDITIHSN